jgi:hypothetical protein
MQVLRDLVGNYKLYKENDTDDSDDDVYVSQERM